ncbi:MAG: AMP-binding protein, partial [Pseudomonadota bacterium]
PFSAPLSGAELVFPGSKLDGVSLFDLLNETETRSAWGVPTIWAGLLQEIADRDALPQGFDHVVSGGAAAPANMITSFEGRGVDVCHSWGMTEMSPIGSHGQTFAPLADLSIEEKLKFKTTQGRRMFGVDMKIVDENGQALPHDGTSIGELFVRGNSIVSGYFKNEEASAKALDSDGWFATGDMATIDPSGFMAIADRAKDLIKTGGEWISSIDLENCAMSHPGVATCAVVGAYHPKWDERPLLIVVTAEGAAPDRQSIIDHLAAVFAKWQLPDDVIFVDDLPMTATGKVSKLDLRTSYKYHLHEPASV